MEQQLAHKKLDKKTNKKIKSFFGDNDEELHKESEPGRILMTPDAKTKGWPHGHSAIASEGRMTIQALPEEAFPDQEVGKVASIPNRFDYKYDSYAVLEVEDASEGEHYEALQEAQKYLGCPFNNDWYQYKKTDAFYCSQLVWRAWHEQGYDLNDGGIVFPDDLVESEATSAVYTRNMNI